MSIAGDRILICVRPLAWPNAVILLYKLQWKNSKPKTEQQQNKEKRKEKQRLKKEKIWSKQRQKGKTSTKIQTTCSFCFNLAIKTSCHV